MTVATERLDVGVNLAFIAPGRVGGSEEYLVRQLTGLMQVAGDRYDLTLYVQPGFVAAHRHLAERSSIVSMPFERDWRGARIVLEHTWFARAARRHDLVHHGGGTAPLNTPRPAVVTVHDLQYREFPQYFSRGRLAYLRQMMPRAMRRATIVTVPSEFVKGTVLDAFDVDPDSVVVVPHGIPEPPIPDELQIESARRDAGLESTTPYVVYPAITHPHKRHDTVVTMLRHLPDHRLVLLGGVGAAEQDVVSAIGNAGVGDRVVRPGRVPADVRDAFIAGADALVFPSAYEGFGAPLVEAMALSTPVVASAHAAVREVVGDAAVIIDTDDPERWAAGVTEAIDRRDDLVRRGLRRRQRFTVETSGAALANAYRLAAERGPRLAAQPADQVADRP